MPDFVERPFPDASDEFDIVPSVDPAEPWHAASRAAAVTVLPSGRNGSPSKRLESAPALMWKDNRIKGALTENPQKEQALVCELNGVFVHVKSDPDKVRIVVADRRLA